MDSDDSYPPYTLEDDSQHADPIPPTDSWGQFLSMRFWKRRAFYDGLDEPEQQLIAKELQRIEYFRRKRSASDARPFLALLEVSRTHWNAIAFERAQEELSKRRGIATEERNCRILREVRRRGGDTSSGAQFSILNEKDTVNIMNYNPDEPDYGYNGWLMTFEDGRRGIDDPRCYGRFPHQKISIRQLLYNKDETPLYRSENKNELRYFHLPANNMAWVEVGPVQLESSHEASGVNLNSGIGLLGSYIAILPRGKVRFQRTQSAECEIENGEVA
jgi:hypothetical protein